MLRSFLAIVLLVPFTLVGCGDTDDTDGDDGTGGPGDVPDTSQAGMQQFLDDQGFADWTSEAEPRPPIPGSGSPHGDVRVYFSPLLEDSLVDGNDVHPVGSAVVKEVYDDMDAVSNYFMYVRTSNDAGQAGYAWYREDTPIYIDGQGFCGDCHEATDGNIDMVITPLP